MTTTTTQRPRRWLTRITYLGLYAAPLAPLALDLLATVL